MTLPGAWAALTCWVCTALFLLLGPSMPPGLAGVAGIQIVCLAVPCLVISWLARQAVWQQSGCAPLSQKAKQTLGQLGIVRPRLHAVVGALLIGASFWYVNDALVGRFVEDWLGNEDARAVESSMLGDASFGSALLVLAVFPAVGEELLFRGVLTRSVAARFGTSIAITTTAVLFGLFHLTAVRIIPMVSFGVVLGLVTLSSASVLPAILIHAINNAIAVGIRFELVHPERGWLGSVIAGGVFVLGVALTMGKLRVFSNKE